VCFDLETHAICNPTLNCKVVTCTLYLFIEVLGWCVQCSFNAQDTRNIILSNLFIIVKYMKHHDFYAK
jgi:hypothetical protein